MVCGLLEEGLAVTGEAQASEHREVWPTRGWQDKLRHAQAVEQPGLVEPLEERGAWVGGLVEVGERCEVAGAQPAEGVGRADEAVEVGFDQGGDGHGWS